MHSFPFAVLPTFLQGFIGPEVILKRGKQTLTSQLMLPACSETTLCSENLMLLLQSETDFPIAVSQLLTQVVPVSLLQIPPHCIVLESN